MRQAKLGLWTNGVEGSIVGHRPIDPGEDDARVDFPTAARGHGPPRGGRRREVPLGCADGRAPLSALPGLGRAKCAPRRSARRALAGARGLARRCVQAPGPRPLDRVAARAAVSPPSPHRQQRAVPHLARVRRGEPRFAGAGAEPSPALGRLPRNAWPSNSDRRNLRRSGPLHRRVLPGGELAGAGPHPRLCPQARHARDLGPPRQTQGGPGLPAGPRRARATVPPRRCPKVAKRRRPATVDRPSTAKPVGVSSWCARFPQHARAALSAGHDRGHRGRREACRIPRCDRDRRVLPSVDPASASCPAGVLQPPSGALHRPVHDRVRQGSHQLGPRCARPRGAHLGRAAGLAHRPRRHRREVHPRCRPAQSGRQAPARRRCGAPLWNRPRTRGGRGQEQRDPGRAYPGHRARPHRPRRDPRRDAHQPPHRPVLGRAVRRATT